LIEFKKGPFHIWEQLDKAPIVPLLIFGAFDLFPPGEVVTLTIIIKISWKE